jgi:uncharacterized coiled-coil protein SlyX
MQEKIAENLEQYVRERNALITEANERVQQQQQALNEHNARMSEIQNRVSQLEGAIQALGQLTASPPLSLSSPQSSPLEVAS